MQEKKQAFIYKIINTQNGKFYIGSTTDLVRRWSEHKGQLEKSVHANKKLQEDFNLVKDVSYFTLEVIEETTYELKDKIEEGYISKYLGSEVCYNENKDNNRPHKINIVYLYDIITLKPKYSFEGYKEAGDFCNMSTGKISDAIWGNKTIYIGEEPYKIGLTEDRYMTVEERILSHKGKINVYDLTKKEMIASYDNSEDYLREVPKEYIRGVFTKYPYNNILYYFDNEYQPTKALLSDRNKLVARYDNFGRLLEVFDKTQFSKDNRENWERIRGTIRKNARALESEGKANFNKTFDGYIYLVGASFENIIPVHLTKMTRYDDDNKSKIIEIKYFNDKTECGNYLGVTNSAVVYALKHNGRTNNCKIEEVLTTEINIDDLP